MDLGARPAKVFFLITLPIILPAILRGLAARLHALLGRPRDHELRDRPGFEHAAGRHLLEDAPRRQPGHQRARDHPGARRRDRSRRSSASGCSASRSGASWTCSAPSPPTSDAGLQAAGRRDHDLHGDVAPRRRDGRDQPRAGLPRLRPAGAAARAGRASPRRRPQPVRADGGTARAVRGDCRGCGAPARLAHRSRRRDHGHRRRHRGDLRRDPRRRARGRGGDPARSELRLLRAGRGACRRARRARAARGRGLRHRLGRASRRRSARARGCWSSTRR